MAFSLIIPFNYQIKRQRRKSIALHVLDDASVEVRAPKWLPASEIDQFVAKRIEWVVEQRNERLEKLEARQGYFQGQRHNYLGRSFALNVVGGTKVKVALVDNTLHIVVRDPHSEQQIERALGAWYRERAVEVFEERLFACFEAFPDWFQDRFIMPPVKLRKMRRRWGSCSSSGQITLNLSLIKMPHSCIDYVITHELCHLQEFDHGREFYRLLAAVMPNWRELEQHIETIA